MTVLRSRTGAAVGRLAAALAATTMLALVGAAATASPAAAAHPTGQADAGVLATCEYVVVDDWTPVQDNPNVNATVLQYKWSADYVYGPCWEAYDSGSGTWFVAVDCTCSPNGIGWIRSYWVLH